MILDDKIVDEEDVGCNFFLEETSIGLSRAGQTCKLLGELNPDVKGQFLVQVLPYLLGVR
jgi:amyloid beta precursor protein binding protein 1